MNVVVGKVDPWEYRMVLDRLQRVCFRPKEILHPLEGGLWWLAWTPQEYVGFACLQVKGSLDDPWAYLARGGVLPKARGQGLQLRLIHARCRKALDMGLDLAVADTTNNLASANNLIRAGFLQFNPNKPWALPQSTYWRKTLGPAKNKLKAPPAASSALPVPLHQESPTCH